MTLRLPSAHWTWTRANDQQTRVALETALNVAPALQPPTVTFATAVTLAPAVLGAVASIGALTNNITITLSGTGLLTGSPFRLYFKQDGVGGRTVTWSGVSWGTGGAPALTTTLNTETVVDFFWDGTNMVGKLYATGV